MSVFDEDVPDFYDTTSFNSPTDVDKIADGKEKYIVVGERHGDPAVADEVVIPLLETGKIDTLLLEAFTMGPKIEEPDERYNYFSDAVYTWNPEKYDRITEAAKENDVDVYGIDSQHRAEEVFETSFWALEAVKRTKEKSLIVTGSVHSRAAKAVDIPLFSYEEDLTIESMLPEKSVTVAVAEIGENFEIEEPSEIDEGLYKSEQLPRFLPKDFVKNDRRNFIFVR